MVLKGKESTRSDSDVSQLPLPKILRLLIENAIDKLVLDIDVGVDLLRKIRIVDVTTLQMHFFVDNLREPIVMKRKIVDKFF